MIPSPKTKPNIFAYPIANHGRVSGMPKPWIDSAEAQLPGDSVSPQYDAIASIFPDKALNLRAHWSLLYPAGAARFSSGGCSGEMARKLSRVEYKFIGGFRSFRLQNTLFHFAGQCDGSEIGGGV